MNLKTCSKCGEIKPETVEFFQKHIQLLCGFRSDCKKCTKEYDAKKYSENKEQIYERSKLWRINNPEKVIIRSRKYSAENPELYREYRRKYYEQNREVFGARSRAYEKNNPEKVKAKKALYRSNNLDKERAAKQRRNAIKKSLPANFTSQDWQVVLKKFGNECAYCGAVESMTQDHFIALTKGGEYTINNIIPACSRCNFSKHNKDFFEWYPKYRHYSKEREAKILKYLNYKTNNVQQLALI